MAVSINSVVASPFPAAGASLDFGDGSDGDATLDGVNTYAWASLAGSTYTLLRPIFLDNLTVNSGIILEHARCSIHVAGTLTNAGTIRGNGTNGVNATADVGGDGGTANSGVAAGKYASNLGPNAAAGNAGGGSGGGGGMGGFVYVVTETLSALGTVTANGGTKGTKGLKHGTGTNGNDGTNGDAGLALVFESSSGTWQ